MTSLLGHAVYVCRSSMALLWLSVAFALAIAKQNVGRIVWVSIGLFRGDADPNILCTHRLHRSLER